MQGLQRREAIPTTHPLRQEILFGGEKGALNAPAGAGPMSVDVAKKLEGYGMPPSDIFAQTGWYRGPDEQWKWTLSDKGASLNPNAFHTYTTGGGNVEVALKPGEPRKLSDVLNHPTLYEVYPDLKNISVDRLPPEDIARGVVADYNSGSRQMRVSDLRHPDDVISSILHELQHDIQKNEGFGSGGTPALFYPSYKDRGGAPLTKKMREEAEDKYFQIAGEVEARQAQQQFRTQNWSQLPSEMEGFPKPEEQYVRKGSSTELTSGKSYQLVPVDHDPFTTTPVDYDPFAMKPVDHDPYATPTNPYEHALQQYPILRDQGVVGVQGNGPMLESWPVNEPGAPGRPRPTGIPIDKFGVEYRDSDRPLDILGDVVSHHMIDKDPVVKKYYDNFTASLDDTQRQRLQEQYQYAQQNEGETRPYEQWEEKSGLPAYFRGYPFQQWPDEFNQQAYTPDQRDHLDRMMQYLQGPEASPTPY